MKCTCLAAIRPRSICICNLESEEENQAKWDADLADTFSDVEYDREVDYWKYSGSGE